MPKSGYATDYKPMPLIYKLFGNKADLPATIYAQAFPKLPGGRSIYDQLGEITVDNFDEFVADPAVYEEAVRKLRDAGFDVLVQGKASISIAAPPAIYASVFKTSLATRLGEVSSGTTRGRRAKVVMCEDTSSEVIGVENSPLADVLECVAIEGVARYSSVSHLATYPRRRFLFIPTFNSCWHLQIPGGVELALGAAAAHRMGYTGRGVKVAVVDTGCWTGHPYFEWRGANLTLLQAPGVTAADADPIGHGTAMCSSVLAVAPDAEVVIVKSVKVPPGRGLLDKMFPRPRGTPALAAAIQYAIEHVKPDIISISFTSGHPATATAVIDAIKEGIVVVVSAGNDATGSLMAEYPDVIAVGGVYMKKDGSTRASKFSSCYLSTRWKGRRVPDVCGLMGTRCSQRYFVLPVPPGSTEGRKSGWRSRN